MHTPDNSPPNLDITSVRFLDLPPAGVGNGAEAAATSREMANLILELRPGDLLLTAAQYMCLATATDPHAAFTEVLDFKTGREASRHGVFFGDLQVRSEKDPTIRRFVAVKPYDSRKVDLLGRA